MRLFKDPIRITGNMQSIYHSLLVNTETHKDIPFAQNSCTRKEINQKKSLLLASKTQTHQSQVRNTLNLFFEGFHGFYIMKLFLNKETFLFRSVQQAKIENIYYMLVILRGIKIVQ